MLAGSWASNSAERDVGASAEWTVAGKMDSRLRPGLIAGRGRRNLFL